MKNLNKIFSLNKRNKKLIINGEFDALELCKVQTIIGKILGETYGYKRIS